MRFSFPEREFYMVRHGESEANVNDMLSAPHTPLTLNGRKQAEALEPVFRTLFPKANAYQLIVSELPRAQITCDLMTGNARYLVDCGLNEIDNKRFAEKVSVHRINQIREYLDQREPGKQFDDRLAKLKTGQTRTDHKNQCIEAVLTHLQLHPGKIPVFVSHIWPMKHTAAALGHGNFKPANATLYHFVPDPVMHHWEIRKVSMEHGQIVETPAEHSTVPHFPALLSSPPTPGPTL